MKTKRQSIPMPFTPPPISWGAVQSLKAAAEWYACQPMSEVKFMPIKVRLAFSNLCELTGVKVNGHEI